MTVGVLALQGDFARHAAALARCGVRPAEVRKPAELDDVGGLIMPGGESTTLLTLMRAWDFGPAIQAFHAAGRPLFGTCAGLILLAREVEHPRQASLGLIGTLFMLYGSVLLIIESRMALGAVMTEMDFLWKVSQKYAGKDVDTKAGGPFTWLGRKI